MELTKTEKKELKILANDIAHNIKNKYNITKENEITIFQTKQPKSNYRTIETIIADKGHLKLKTFVQHKYQTEWKFIPNSTYIKNNDNTLTLDQLPSALPRINFKPLTVKSKLLNSIKKMNPKNRYHSNQQNMSNYEFGGIFQLFPPHRIIEIKYPKINDYLSLKNE